MKRFAIKFTLALVTIFTPGLGQAAVPFDRNAAVNDYPLYDPTDYGAGCPAPGSGGSTPLSGTDHVAATYNFLIGKSLTPEQASGVIGNMILESGIGPQRLEGTGLNDITPYDSITATYPTDGWGIVQWTPHTKVGDAVKAAGKNPNDMAAQLDFLWLQLNTNESAALTALKATSTPDDAAMSFATKYERPSASALAASSVDRKVNAIAVWLYMTTGTTIPDAIKVNISTSPLSGSTSAGSPTTGSTSCPTTATSTGSGPYKNPFRDWPSIIPYRIDNGVDYDGANGPIYSIGNGKVITVARSGDPAYNYIIYELSDGPAAGKRIFLAENCTFPVNQGQALTPDTVICDFHRNTNPFGLIGIEIGWSGPGFNISWNNGPFMAQHPSNAGLDMNRFLVKLGAPSGVDDGLGTRGNPPADWPVW